MTTLRALRAEWPLMPWEAVLRSGVGPRMVGALCLLAHGESYRTAAAAAGYADHRDLQRYARRFGIDWRQRRAKRLRKAIGLVEEIEALGPIEEMSFAARNTVL